MRILFLDDDETRHELATKRFAGHDLFHVWNVDQFRRAIRGDRFDRIYLDHDLGDFIPGPYDQKIERTGYDAATYVASLEPEKRPELTVVHSWNPEGANRMMRVLQSRGVPCAREMFTYG